MGQKYYRNIDLLANQLLNSRLHNISTTDRVALGTTLSGISKGYMVYDTDLLSPYFWNGTQWVTAGGGGGGTVTSVTATLPLSSTGGSTPDISIQQANGSQNGYLSSGDWTIFNSKQNALTNPVTGTGTLNYLPKWSTNGSTLADSIIFDNGTSVGIGTVSPNALNKLEVAGIIATTSGINLDTNPANKTGLYSGTNTFTFWAGNNQLSTYTLVGNAAGSYFSHTIPFNNSTGSVIQNAWRIASSVVDTGVNSIIHNQLIIDPQYVHGVLGTGLVRGVYYNPTVTSLNGAFHVAWENTSGDIIHGNLATGGAAQMVTADSNGKLGIQTIPSGGGGLQHGIAAGTDTYTVTIAGAPTSYSEGDAYIIRFTNGNTTSATLNINSIGAVPLYRNNDGVLIGGDITAGGDMLCVYDVSIPAFRVIGTSPNMFFSYVTNADSVTITKGQVVYAFGGQGDRMTVKLANNTGDATSARTVGLVVSTSIAANQKGLIMIQGLLDGLSILPTATWNDGDPIYLGATPGSITKVKPYAPAHLVYIGTVTTASNGSAGRMYVKIQNGYELDELHNVQAQSPSPKDTLWYDNTVSPAQWKTASITTILGYTPIQRSVNVVSTATAAGSTAGTDYVYLVSGTSTVTLPTAVGNTNRYTIKRSGTGVVSIATTSSQTIDGSSSPITINVQYVSIDLISNGTNWEII